MAAIGSPSVLYVIYNTFVTLLLPSLRFICVLQYFMDTLSILYVIYTTFETLALPSLRFVCVLQYFLNSLSVLYVIHNSFETQFAAQSLFCG